eukprot:1158188-Pelagomonas_calceolata.AAC.2
MNPQQLLKVCQQRYSEASTDFQKKSARCKLCPPQPKACKIVAACRYPPTLTLASTGSKRFVPPPGASATPINAGLQTAHILTWSMAIPFHIHEEPLCTLRMRTSYDYVCRSAHTCFTSLAIPGHPQALACTHACPCWPPMLALYAGALCKPWLARSMLAPYASPGWRSLCWHSMHALVGAPYAGALCMP